jgi:uncharacterized protein
MFDWDDVKNRENLRKHGVGFETASGIFEGPVLTTMDDREDYGELREISIGRVGIATILTVAHTDRNGRVRIISARAATSSERRRYDEALRKGLI